MEIDKFWLLKWIYLDKKKLYSFGCENYIKFVRMEVKSFDFREEKKNERCVGRIWHVEKKKKLHGVFVKFQ